MTTRTSIASEFPIPDAALANHIAVVGMTGSGKTSTEKLIVEHLVAQGHRVCILDTLKSDWWGITSSADGKRPGLPFRILGGPRGHVPLHSSAGKAIGQLVGAGKLPLSIVDMADLEPGGAQRFFTDFAAALWKSARGVVYLVIEEAHEIAPKERAGFNAENMAIHWAKKLATGSRTKGIRLLVATQRTQALHNAVLGSCSTLIAHRIMFDADQEPVIRWVKTVDKKMVGEIGDSLASLPQGTAWVCSGHPHLFERSALPKFATFDNTRTPDKDAEEFDVATAPVNPEELRAIIGDAVKEAEDNDPKVLKASIAALQRQLAQRAPAPAAAAPDHAALMRADEAGYRRGAADGLAEAARETLRAIRVLREHADEIAGCLVDEQARFQKLAAEAADVAQPVEHRASNARVAGSSPAVRSTPTGRRPPALQRILDAIAWAESLGMAQADRSMVAFLADASSRSSSYANNLSALRTAGLIDYPGDGAVCLTPAGRAEATAPSEALTHAAIMEKVNAKLAPACRRILVAVTKSYPKPIGRAIAADQAEASPTSSSFANNLSLLRTLGLITYPDRGSVRADDRLFP